MTSDFEALIYNHFPFGEEYRYISELKDFRNLLFQMLTRSPLHREAAETLVEVTLEPEEVVCEEIESAEVIEAWKELFCCCLSKAPATHDTLVATWSSQSLQEYSGSTIGVECDPLEGADTQEYNLPLVWDEDSWATQLVTQQWWPDLQRCVESYFRANPALRNYDGVRDQPIPLRCTREFLKSIEQFCGQEHLRRALVEALTKRVYGILDSGLGDEQFQDKRRFRVTRFWRVHYHWGDNEIVLEEFGPHSIGGAD
jgi:hypothetical protein